VRPTWRGIGPNESTNLPPTQWWARALGLECSIKNRAPIGRYACIMVSSLAVGMSVWPLPTTDESDRTQRIEKPRAGPNYAVIRRVFEGVWPVTTAFQVVGGEPGGDGYCCDESDGSDQGPDDFYCDNFRSCDHV